VDLARQGGHPGGGQIRVEGAFVPVAVIRLHGELLRVEGHPDVSTEVWRGVVRALSVHFELTLYLYKSLLHFQII
jgi:hypothetical protein